MLTGNEFAKRLNTLNAEEERIGGERVKLLRDAGWELSSDYMSSYWLWSKDFPASKTQKTPPKSYAGVSLHTALKIESAFRTLYLDKTSPEYFNDPRLPLMGYKVRSTP